MQIFVLTITDASDFDRVMHQSAWDCEHAASNHAHETIIPSLIHMKGKDDIPGDTFNISLEELTLIQTKA